MYFFRTSRTSLFFGFVFDFFFCFWVVFCDLHFAFCSAYNISIHINLWTWCGYDTGLPPRKPRSFLLYTGLPPVSPAYMGLPLEGLTGARPRMLNILHMSSNMCVFAYIVYHINTFIYILILHTGLHPVNPAYIKSYFLYGIAPRMGVYGGLPPWYISRTST